jgi:dihydroxy-acid dehydratase
MPTSSRIEENACPTCGSCSGMFTANSMNCLVEGSAWAARQRLGLATGATRPLEKAGEVAVQITRAFYDEEDASVLPRAVASPAAFANAMALDIAMGGSTNTILHLLAAAHEAGIDFGLDEIDAISRRVPCLAKIAPNPAYGRMYYMEDVHRAGGIPTILGELHRAGLLNSDVSSIHSPSLEAWLAEWDVRGGTASETAHDLWHAAPGGVRSSSAFSQSERWASLDEDAENGCIRSAAHAYSVDGGLAVLRATSPSTAPSSRPPVSTRRSSSSRARPSCASRRRRRWRRSSARRCNPAMSSSSATRVPRADPACRRCCTPPRSSRARPGQGLRAGHRWPLLGRHVGPVDRSRLAGGASGGIIALVEDGDIVDIDILTLDEPAGRR